MSVPLVMIPSEMSIGPLGFFLTPLVSRHKVPQYLLFQIDQGQITFFL